MRNEEDLEDRPVRMRRGAVPRLKEFFAVTLTSIYRVSVNDGQVSAVKIALRDGVNSGVPVGTDICPPGNHLMISRRLISYVPLTVPEGEFEDFYHREMGPILEWTVSTSDIVGMFLTEREAMRCFAESDLRPADPRWVNQSWSVIDGIGDWHQQIYVSWKPEGDQYLPRLALGEWHVVTRTLVDVSAGAITRTSYHSEYHFWAALIEAPWTDYLPNEYFEELKASGDHPEWWYSVIYEGPSERRAANICESPMATQAAIMCMFREIGELGRRVLNSLDEIERAAGIDPDEEDESVTAGNQPTEPTDQPKESEN